MAVYVTLLMMLTGIAPRIRHVPRVIDRQLATRYNLCPHEATDAAVSQTNEPHHSVAEFLGPELLEIQVHQFGRSFRNFGRVASHIRDLLGRRPRSFSRLTPWAEATPMAGAGILGTLRYTHDRTGRFEIAGVHACVEDSAGTFWWIRLAPGDLWP
jgi:hypothetical protein